MITYKSDICISAPPPCVLYNDLLGDWVPLGFPLVCCLVVWEETKTADLTKMFTRSNLSDSEKKKSLSVNLCLLKQLNETTKTGNSHDNQNLQTLKSREQIKCQKLRIYNKDEIKYRTRGQCTISHGTYYEKVCHKCDKYIVCHSERQIKISGEYSCLAAPALRAEQRTFAGLILWMQQ